MILIIIGIFIFVLNMIALLKLCAKTRLSSLNFFLRSLSCFIGFILFLSGFSSSVSGYEDPSIEQFELSNITVDNNSYYVLYLKEENLYVVNCKFKHENQPNFHVIPVDYVNIDEISTDEHSLSLSIQKGKRSLFTFAIGQEKVTYDLIVPKGTIIGIS